MDIKFEGDIANIVEPALELCRRILTDKGYTKCTVQVEPVGKLGDNYMANVKRFIAHQDDVNDGKPFKIVGKLAPTMEQLRAMMNTDIAFRNETITYEQLLPKYDELQQTAQIPKEEWVRYPKCYGTISEGPNETIFLEDVNELDFVMHNRLETMSDDKIKLALKELAKFHSLGYILKEKDPVFYDDMKRKLVNLWVLLQNSEQMQQFLEMLAVETEKCLTDENDKKIVGDLLRNNGPILLALCNQDKDSKYATLIQGDCWPNNMVFKNENEVTKEIIMLDYQIVRISSPASDILYFLLSCTDYEMRASYFHSWIDYYYKSLEDSFANFNLKANCIYSRDRLYADLHRYGKIHLGIALMQANMMVRESEDIVDFKEDPSLLLEISSEVISMNNMREKIMLKLIERVNGLIKTGKEFGYVH